MSKSSTSSPRYGVIVLTVAFTAFALYAMRDYLVTVLMALVFGLILEPAFNTLSRHLKTNRSVTAIITLILVLFAVIIPCVLFSTLILDETLSLAKSVKPWFNEQFNSARPMQLNLPAWFPMSEQINQQSEKLFELLPKVAAVSTEFAFGFLNTLVRGSVTTVFQLFIFVYALFFFLGRSTKVAHSIFSITPFTQDESDVIITRATATAKSIFKSIFIVGAAQGFLITLAFWITGLPHAVFFGVFVAILSAIPLIGSGIVWIPACIFLLSHGHTASAVGMALWGLFVVGLIDNILRPRIVGKDVKIPDLLILLSILGGVRVFGFSGLIIGPVIISIYLAVVEIYKGNKIQNYSSTKSATPQ